jgi:hypothetical protein
LEKIITDYIRGFEENQVGEKVEVEKEKEKIDYVKLNREMDFFKPQSELANAGVRIKKRVNNRESVLK